MALGEKIERVGREHLGKAITFDGISQCVFLVPTALCEEDTFEAVTDNGKVERGFLRCGIHPWHYWIPDEPEEKRKKPSETLGGWLYSSNRWHAGAMSIFDDLDARLRALEER